MKNKVPIRDLEIVANELKTAVEKRLREILYQDIVQGNREAADLPPVGMENLN